MFLRVTSEQLRLLRREAEKAYPIEACALLFGRMVNDEVAVVKIVLASNILRSTVRFEVDPQTVFNAFKEAEGEGVQFIGFFHSHPAPATPSAVDLQYMRLWGEAVWLILSSIDGGMAAFRMVNGEVHEVALKVVRHPSTVV